MKAKSILDKWELKGLQKLETLETRILAEHQIPGMDGGIFQNMGDSPAEIILEGSLQGDEVRLDFLEQIRDKFKAAKPVPFVADITTATDVTEVLIKDLKITESAFQPDAIAYAIILKEYTPPPPEPAGLASQVESAIKNEADLRFASALDALEAKVPLKELGIDIDIDIDRDKASSLMDNIDTGKLTDFLGGLDAVGKGLFSDLLDAIPLDAIKELAEALGISLPPSGYKSEAEVLSDLLEGVSQMLTADTGSWASSLGATSTKITAKLLVTLVTGEIENCDSLVRTFKDAVAEIWG
jgi:hypothetical protein